MRLYKWQDRGAESWIPCRIETAARSPDDSKADFNERYPTMSPRPIEITGHQQQASWIAKTMPPVEKIRGDVWSIPVPIPQNPMRYTLSYLIRANDGNIIIDPGWDSDEGLNSLEKGLWTAGVEISELTGIVVTHFHEDHLGLAGRVRAASGAWVAMGATEVRVLSTMAPHIAAARDRRLMSRWGVPREHLAKVGLTAEILSRLNNMADPDLRLTDRQLVPAEGLRLRVVTTPGHSPGHICLVDEERGLIFSGDHVLPRISPNISYEVGGPPNPLQDYYESLSLKIFDDTMEVCPAHEYRFIGMRRRSAQLIEHNRTRSAEVLQVLADSGPVPLVQIAKRLTWSRGWESLHGHTLRLALSETASHMIQLRALGHAVHRIHDSEHLGLNQFTEDALGTP